MNLYIFVMFEMSYLEKLMLVFNKEDNEELSKIYDSESI